MQLTDVTAAGHITCINILIPSLSFGAKCFKNKKVRRYATRHRGVQLTDRSAWRPTIYELTAVEVSLALTTVIICIIILQIPNEQLIIL